MSENEENHGVMHDQIWAAIDRLAQTFGYSPSGLAKQAGLDPTSFNKSKRVSADGKPRWPSTESVARILAATGANMSEFLSFMDDSGLNQDVGMPRFIPMIGFAQAGNQGFFDEDGYPAGGSWDEIRFPEHNPAESDGIYALEVSGDSMEPLYREGDRLIVSPAEKIKRGDRVIVKTKKGEVLAKQLSRRSAGKINLRSLNENYDTRSFSPEDISWMARIIWVSQ